MTWNPEHSLPLDRVMLEERVSRLACRSLKRESKVKALKLALGLIDLTTLEGKDTEGKVRALCEKAKYPDQRYGELPHVAALCVYPIHVGLAKSLLQGSGIKVASVAGYFPSGSTDRAIKRQDVRFALDQDADEIDMVLNRSAFLKGEYNLAFDEIAEIKALCRNKCLKVILETGEMPDLDALRKAAELAMFAGADFIKTSTGKIASAANPLVSLVMLEAIRDFHQSQNKEIGFKAAGGISSAKAVLQYLVLVEEVLGNSWLHAERLRFGASSLANDILLQLNKEKWGHYYSKDYIAQD